MRHLLLFVLLTFAPMLSAQVEHWTLQLRDGKDTVQVDSWTAPGYWKEVLSFPTSTHIQVVDSAKNEHLGLHVINSKKYYELVRLPERIEQDPISDKTFEELSAGSYGIYLEGKEFRLLKDTRSYGELTLLHAELINDRGERTGEEIWLMEHCNVPNVERWLLKDGRSGIVVERTRSSFPDAMDIEMKLICYEKKTKVDPAFFSTEIPEGYESVYTEAEVPATRN